MAFSVRMPGVNSSAPSVFSASSCSCKHPDGKNFETDVFIEESCGGPSVDVQSPATFRGPDPSLTLFNA